MAGPFVGGTTTAVMEFVSALGLIPEHTRSIQINIEWDGMMTLSSEQYVPESNFVNAKLVLKRYQVTLNELPAPSEARDGPESAAETSGVVAGLDSETGEETP